MRSSVFHEFDKRDGCQNMAIFVNRDASLMNLPILGYVIQFPIGVYKVGGL